MIIAGGILLFLSGYALRALHGQDLQVSARRDLGPVLEKKLRRTRAPWIQK